MRLHKNILNENGQGLIEYLVIVALVAVAGIAVMKVVGQNVRAQFANVADAIQGNTGKAKLDEVRESHYKKRDMGDFFRGAANREQDDDKK
jgi:pilus assembly protein Flp/PilA